jgi:hypothetical protein
VKVHNRNQTCDLLPKPKVKASQFQVHISYFLQKCKKGKPSKTDLPSWKTISQVFEASDIYMFIADVQSSDKKKARSLLKPAFTSNLFIS